MRNALTCGQVTLAIGFAVVSIGAAADAPGSVSGPILGYLANQDRPQVRAITGVPGAASFGDWVSLSADVVHLRIAPGEPYALLERRDSDPAVFQLTGASPGQAVSISGAVRSADLAAFSPFGTSVVLFSQAAARLQVLTGFPAAPRVLRDLDTHSLPEAPAALAVSEDGKSVLLSSATNIYVLSGDGSTRTLAATGGAAAMAFFPNSSDAALGDPMSGSVYRFEAQTGTASLRAVSATLKGLAAIAAGTDGDTVYVMRPGTRQIASVGLSSGGVETWQVPAGPERMDRMGRADRFLISSQAGQAAWIVEGQEKRAVFIPDSARPKPHPRYVPMPVGSR
jgi:hypothetical protein